jgi:protein O-GlcNAc transferase
MLAAAAAKLLYAELHEADLMDFLIEDTRRWQLMLAADVLIYFGALDELLGAARSRLEPGGWFVFSLEELLPDHDGVVPGDGDWALQRQGRARWNVKRCGSKATRRLPACSPCSSRRAMTTDAALERLHSGDPAGALLLLDAAASSDLLDPELLVARGVVQLANHCPAKALPALRSAVALGETAPATLLNLALAEMQAGDTARAFRLMQGLELRLPEWDEPPLRLAEALRAAGRMQEAEQAYGRVLDINPRRESALLGLAGLLIMRGDGAAARGLLLRCCGIAPHRADAWDTLGLALRATDGAPVAESAFAKAQALAPNVLEYALHRVEAACSAGTEEGLLAWLEVASAEDPLSPVLAAARGILLERLGRRAEAADALEAAAALAPDAPLLAYFLGEVLARCNRLREAEAALRRAGELDPDNAQLRNTRATVLFRMHRHAEARTELLASIERNGEHVHELCNLANATTCLGLQDEAVALARRAIELAPDAVLPRRALCNTLPYRDGVTGAELLAALRDCSDRLPREPPPIFANRPDPDRPLVLGLLSGSLRTHPVGWLTVAGFETLDAARLSTVCLAQNASDDWIARRFRSLAREWHDVDALNDLALAAKSRALGIDILIDLGGYGDAARMPACAHRMAPVQVKWVGMQNHSSGLAEMDWIITDRWETPAELKLLYSERLLCMPDGYVCYSAPPYAPDVAPLPALANGHITFGCFNNLAKITPRVVATWCGILHRLPGSRLVLKAHQFAHAPTAERVLANFAEYGIRSERIELRGPSGHRTFIGQYNDIDIVLDPFPYSGGLTTCEALWMGVPTVTMPGEIFASRHSVSHLSNAGLADWVASDAASYADLAMAKASDIAALAALRSGLRAQVKASPLCDATRFGRNLGAALRFAWRDWCARAAQDAGLEVADGSLVPRQDHGRQHR